MSAIQAIRRVVGVMSVILLTFVFVYVSKFWIWIAPWSGDGLFGAKIVSPYGNLLHWWLAGTGFSEFNYVIWGCGAIALLSVLQWVAVRIWK